MMYDGFLRLALDSVLGSKFVHLMSELSPYAQGCTGTPRIDWVSGFSEWHSQDLRPISIGWDWSVFVDERNELALERVGPLRSNVMLVDGHGQDYGWLESLEVLGTVVDALPWRELVWHSIPLLSPA